MYAYIGGENWIVNIIIHWGLYILSVMGIYAWFQDRKNLLYGLVMVSALGIFISVPFMPPTDAYRLRAYAASIIIIAALPAMGFVFLLKKTKLDFITQLGNNLSKSSIPLVFSSILISITLIGPILILSIIRPPLLKPVACTTNEEFILVRFDDGTHLNIKKQNKPFLDQMPNYHIGQFKENSHSLADAKFIAWANTIEPPTILFTTMNILNNQRALAVLRSETPPATGKYYQLCGKFEIDPALTLYKIFYVNEIFSLPP